MLQIADQRHMARKPSRTVDGVSWTTTAHLAELRVRAKFLGPPPNPPPKRLTPDIIITETGTSSFGLLPVPLPSRVTYVAQILWGSIGWSVGAALGCALAAEEQGGRRTILFVGDGSLQLVSGRGGGCSCCGAPSDKSSIDGRHCRRSAR